MMSTSSIGSAARVFGALGFALALTLASCSSQGWSNVGAAKVAPNAASQGRIAVYNGRVFVAFSDNANGDRLTVMRPEGSSWVPVGPRGFSTGRVSSSDVSLAVDDSGNPWVAFPQSGTGKTELQVMKFTGSAWASQGAAGFAEIAGAPRLVLSRNAAYVAFEDGSNAKARVMALGATGWADLGAGPTYASNLVLGADGATLYLGYNDEKSNLVLARVSAGAWSTVATVPGMTIDERWDPEISVSNGVVYFIFANYKNKAVAMKLTGSTLESVGALGSIANGDDIEYLSGAVFNGVPYVAFDDESRDSDPEPRAATVKRWTGSTWELYAGYPNPCDIEDTMLTVDQANGRLYLTYSDCDGDLTVQVH